MPEGQKSQVNESGYESAQNQKPEHKLKKPARRITNIVRLAVLTMAIVIGGLGWMYHNRNSGQLPSSLKKSVNFAVYYPSALPAGYSLDKKSSAVDKGILFYSLSNNDKKISISEQAVPKIPPDLNAIQKVNTSFKKIDTPAGQAIIGLDPTSQVPVAVIETNTTLVNVSGSEGTPSDVINKLAQSLTSLPQ
jgi:hypothetical protein